MIPYHAEPLLAQEQACPVKTGVCMGKVAEWDFGENGLF
jgi:hypothetical protein